MNRKAVRSTLTLLLALLPVASVLAANSVHFNRISTEQGLPQSVVQAVAQDAAGFIWLGTQVGLSRFDGVTGLLFDADGDLWITTYGGGLNRLRSDETSSVSLTIQKIR